VVLDKNIWHTSRDWLCGAFLEMYLRAFFNVLSYIKQEKTEILPKKDKKILFFFEKVKIKLGYDSKN